MNLEKWKISSINNNSSFVDAAKETLKHRYKDLNEKIKFYLEEQNEPNLHEVRIAIRRLRYSLEVFAQCFKSKDYKKFYDKVEYLQDKTGLLRDIDIMLIHFENEKIEAKNKENIVKNIYSQKTSLTDEIKIELIDFITSKFPKKFIKLLCK